MVVIDTLRADALGSYGGPTATPGFDQLAAEGVLFERAVASAPETAASHATLFTGFDVQHHGVNQNGATLSPALQTLAETFRDAGYSTGAFVSSFVMDPRFGWEQGFDHYDASFPVSGETVHNRGGFWSRHEFDGFDRRAQATNDAALPWLREVQEPFLLFVHYFDPHAPNQPASPYLRRVPHSFAQNRAQRWVGLAPANAKVEQGDLTRFIRSYYAEALYTDDELGRLVGAIDELGLRDRTLVAVTADHGEGLGQHGLLDHAAHLYEEQIHVPWVLRWPGRIPAGIRVGTAVGLVDLAPTVAELAGVSFPGGSDGRSVAAAALGGDEPASRPLLSRRRDYPREFQGHHGTKLSVSSGRWKYIRATHGPDELYDLEVDREEQRNLYDERPAIAARLGAILDEHLAAYPLSNEAPELGDVERRALEALGYGSD